MRFLRRSRSSPMKLKFRIGKKTSHQQEPQSQPYLDETRDELEDDFQPEPEESERHDEEEMEQPWLTAVQSSLSDSLGFVPSVVREPESIMSYASDGSTTKGDTDKPAKFDWDELQDAANLMTLAFSCKNPTDRTKLIESEEYQGALLTLVQYSNTMNVTVKELYTTLRQMKASGRKDENSRKMERHILSFFDSTNDDTTSYHPGSKYLQRKNGVFTQDEKTLNTNDDFTHDENTLNTNTSRYRYDDNTYTSGNEDSSILFPTEFASIVFMERWFSCLFDAIEASLLNSKY